MNFQRTIRIPTSPPRSLVVERSPTTTADFDFEKDRVKKAQDLTIKRPIGILYNNFRRIFPNSVFDRLSVINIDIKGQEGLILNITSQILSSTGKFGYIVHLVMRRDNVKELWSLNHKGELKCQCPAFRYWVAHPDLLSKNFYGKPSRWNLVRNMVKNPSLIPGMCKHLAYLVQQLVNNGSIKP